MTARCLECRRAFEYEQRSGPPPVACPGSCRARRRRRVERDSQRRARAREKLTEARAIADALDTQQPGLGPYTSLSARDLVRLLERRAAGYSARQLATSFGLNLRTVQRYLHVVELQSVTVGRYRAVFAQRRSGRPIQLTEWYGVTGR